MSIKKIACFTDFSENSYKSFQAALELSEKYNAKLYIVHVLPPVVNPLLTDTEIMVSVSSEKSLFLNIEERMQNEYGGRIKSTIDYELVVRDGHVSSEILNFLEEQDIDLAVMGSYGLTGMGLVVFGSVAKRISHKAPCSVMIVR